VPGRHQGVRIVALLGVATPDSGDAQHRWKGAEGRELVKLGHHVKLMPAQYVKPYVKRGKNDAADAEAICEAVSGEK